MPVTLSINKASIRRHLAQVDVDSIDSLRNFVALLDRGCSTGIPTSSIPASSLTLMETFKYFGYRNEIRHSFGAEKPIIPESFIVNVPANTSSYAKFNWLEESLETAGIAWNTHAEATRRIFIESFLTAGLAELRILSDTTAPLHGFCELTLSCCVSGPTGAPLIVTGRCDMAVGYGTVDHQFEGQPRLETFLAIVEAKTELTLQSALPQLLAYMGMVQAARKGTGKINRTVYGFYSDGFNYIFVRVDNEQLVSRSRILSLLDDDLGEIYAFVLHVLRAAQESSPSSSPTKPLAKMEAEVVGFARIVEPRYFLVEPFEQSDEEGDDLVMVV